MVSDPLGERNTTDSTLRDGVKAAVKRPSPDAISGEIPSSFNVTTSPLEIVAVTGPAGLPQVILRADSVAALPTVNAAG